MGTASSRPQFDAETSGARLAPSRAVGPGGEPGCRVPPAAALTDLAGGVAFVLDPSLRCLVADGEALRRAGVDPVHVVGRPLADLLDPPLAAALEPHCRLAVDGHPFAHAHDARGRAYLSRGVPLHGESGAI